MLFPLVRAACCHRLLRLAVARSRLAAHDARTRYSSRSSRERGMRRPIVARSFCSRSSRERWGPCSGSARWLQAGAVEGDEVLFSVAENEPGVLGRNGAVGDHALPCASSSEVARRRRGGGRVQLRRSCPSGLWAARALSKSEGLGGRGQRAGSRLRITITPRCRWLCIRRRQPRQIRVHGPARGGQMRRLVTMLR